VVCRSHLAAGFLFTASMRVLNHQALRPITIQRHLWVYSARPTMRGLALYTVTVDVNRVYDCKARRYAEDNRTESNIVRTGKSEAEVTNNKKNLLHYCG